MRTIAAILVLGLAGCQTEPVATAELIPSDVAPNPAPDPDLAPELAAFVGRWACKWEGLRPSVIVVESVSAEGIADTHYGYFPAGTAGARVHRFEFEAPIRDGAIRFGEMADFVGRIHDDGRLHIVRHNREGGSRTCVYSRV